MSRPNPQCVEGLGRLMGTSSGIPHWDEAVRRRPPREGRSTATGCQMSNPVASPDRVIPIFTGPDQMFRRISPQCGGHPVPAIEGHHRRVSVVLTRHDEAAPIFSMDAAPFVRAVSSSAAPNSAGATRDRPRWLAVVRGVGRDRRGRQSHRSTEVEDATAVGCGVAVTWL